MTSPDFSGIAYDTNFDEDADGILNIDDLDPLTAYAMLLPGRFVDESLRAATTI